MYNQKNNSFLSEGSLNSEKADLEYEEALQYLDSFNTSDNPADLEKAAQKLVKSLEFNQRKIEPYICLSYIFYLQDEEKMAIDYFNIARSLNPDFPKLLALKEILVGPEIEITSDEPSPLKMLLLTLKDKFNDKKSQNTESKLKKVAFSDIKEPELTLTDNERRVNAIMDSFDPNKMKAPQKVKILTKSRFPGKKEDEDD